MMDFEIIHVRSIYDLGGSRPIDIKDWIKGEWTETKDNTGEKVRIIQRPDGKKFRDYLKKEGKHELIPIEEIKETKKENTPAPQKSEIEILKETVFTKILQQKSSEARDAIVTYILSKEHIKTERADEHPVMYIYRDGIYVPHARTYIREFVESVTEQAYTKHMSNEVISRIEASTYVNLEKLYEVADPFEVPLQNGILNLKTKELSPFSPDKVYFAKLPPTYDTTKDCPLSKEFCRQIFAEEETVNIIQELFGYILVRNYFIPKAFLFTGVGRNGKSTLLNLLERFVGRDNTSNVGLQALEKDPYAEAGLHLKYANISSDLPAEGMKDTGKFKALSAGDTMSANRKFMTHLKFHNYAKLLFAANTIPSSRDQSDGFFSRWIILDCPNKFYTKEEIDSMTEEEKKGVRVADRTLIDKLSSEDELSGLLNWGLEGLSRLIANGSFTYSVTTTKLKSLYLLKSNSLAAFFDMYCDTSDVYQETLKQDFRAKYIKFCKDNYVQPRTDKGIAKYMSSRDIYDGKTGSQRVWVGIKIVETN